MSKTESLAYLFSGTLNVESFWVSDDGHIWTLNTIFEPGKLKWSFEVVDTYRNYNGNTVVVGKISGYCELNEFHHLRYLWEELEKMLILEHYIISPYGYTDLFEEVFNVEIAENGKVAIILEDEDELPVKWILSKVAT